MTDDALIVRIDLILARVYEDRHLCATGRLRITDARVLLKQLLSPQAKEPTSCE